MKTLIRQRGCAGDVFAGCTRLIVGLSRAGLISSIDTIKKVYGEDGEKTTKKKKKKKKQIKHTQCGKMTLVSNS